MSAVTILSHQLAGSILIFYGLLALAFTKPQRKPPQPVRPISQLDVDVKFCTVAELEGMMVVILKDARQLTLSDNELSRFWEVNEELKLRRTQSDGRERMAKILSFEVSEELYIRIVAQQQKDKYEFLSPFLRTLISDALTEQEAYNEEKKEGSE